MRDRKDRSAKWMLTHFSDSLLHLAGITGFSHVRTTQPELVTPKQVPDGLMEVFYPDRKEPVLVLAEISTYPYREQEEQMFRDAALVYLSRGV
jgi:hypothetical protein